MNKEWAAKEVVQRNTRALIPYERNPKEHSEEQIQQLANSIREWGWTNPILIDESDNVIAGHGRLFAAQELGIEEVPCIVARNWTDEQRRAYVIADNKLGENGSWNYSILYEELQHIGSHDFDLSLTGMNAEFEAMNFSPNLEPSSHVGMIGSEAIEKAQQHLSQAIENVTTPKTEGGIKCVCPYCAEEFTISGY
jgi:hypothetical protein